MPAGRRWIGSCLLALAASMWLPDGSQPAQAADDPVTGKITLGPHEGIANPSKQGHAKTGGGNIDISQPSPDTLIVRMSGNAAALGSAFVTGTAMFDFFEDVQFAVEFSQPGHCGQLIMQARVNGLLVSHGKQATAGMQTAVASLFDGPEEIATLALPERMVHGAESVAVNVSQGPVCIPIHDGCYALRQQFRMVAVLAKGCILGGRATAEFSPSPLPSLWQGSSYPFAEVDKQALGYTVTLRVVPLPVTAVAHGSSGTASLPAPPATQAAFAPSARH